MFKTKHAAAAGPTQPEAGLKKEYSPRRRFYWLKLWAFFSATLALGFYAVAAPIFHKDLLYKVLFTAAKYPCAWQDITYINGSKGQDHFFKADNGLTLHGVFFKKPGAKKLILFHHGKGLNLTCCRQILEHLLTDDYSVFLYDYEGFGKSEGDTSIAALDRDALAATDFVCRKLGFAYQSIVHCGGSLGTAPAAKAAIYKPCAGLILLDPYVSLYRVGRENIPPLWLYPDFLMPESDEGCYESIRKLRAPLLIVHGSRDDLISVAHSDILSKTATSKVIYARLEGAGHCGQQFVDDPRFDKALKPFLKSLPPNS